MHIDHTLSTFIHEDCQLLGASFEDSDMNADSHVGLLGATGEPTKMNKHITGDDEKNDDHFWFSNISIRI